MVAGSEGAIVGSCVGGIVGLLRGTSIDVTVVDPSKRRSNSSMSAHCTASEGMSGETLRNFIAVDVVELVTALIARIMDTLITIL